MSDVIGKILKDTTLMAAISGDCVKCKEYKKRIAELEAENVWSRTMSDLIQKAIDQTERAKFGLCCEEAIHALDIANEKIAELESFNAEREKRIAELEAEVNFLRWMEGFDSGFSSNVLLAREEYEAALEQNEEHWSDRPGRHWTEVLP